MAKNVRFVQTTKIKWLNRETYDESALYFCTDTNEIFKGSSPYTHGMTVVPTYADLPSCPCAADGVVYYVTETRNGYVMAPDRSGWLQTIYAPATDAYTVPESEIYNTVTTVGAVRDIEAKIYERIEEVASGGGLNNLTPVDGTITITDASDGGKSIGVSIAPVAGNMLAAVDGGLFVPAIKLADDSHGLAMVDDTLTLNLATATSDGAMSKEDKALIDAIPDTYATSKEVADLEEAVSNLEQGFFWGEM